MADKDRAFFMVRFGDHGVEVVKYTRAELLNYLDSGDLDCIQWAKPDEPFGDTGYWPEKRAAIIMGEVVVPMVVKKVVKHKLSR